MADKKIFKKNINDLILRKISVSQAGTIRSEKPMVKKYQNVVLSSASYAGYQLDGKVISETVLKRGYQNNYFYSPDKIIPDYTSVIKKAFYGGHLLPHYGHLITESISRYWVLDKYEYIPVLMFARGQSDDAKRYLSHEIYERLNCVGRLHIINDSVLVEELIIPEPAWIDTSYAYFEMRKAALNLYLKKSENSGRYRRVYLSRSGLEKREYGYIVDEDELEKKLVLLGFEIVHPQYLSFQDQIKIFNESEYVVGLIGSAFHTMLFANCEGLSCVYLCFGSPNVNFPNIDAITNTKGYYVSCAVIHPYAIKKIIMLDVEYAVRSIINIINGVLV